MYPKKAKRIIVWNKGVIKQYLIFISSKILARARARVDGLVEPELYYLSKIEKP
jgi:hypothetical protein